VRISAAGACPPLDSDPMVTRASRPDGAAGSRPDADEPGGWHWNAVTVRATLRRHWLFALLFTLGVLLRVMAQVAYQPAILYFDSAGYLGRYRLPLAEPDPLGYPLAAHLLLGAFRDLAALSAFNHVLGLTMAGLIYAVLLRRGVRPWMAALAAGPVLLDGLQLLIEQMVMSEPLFQFFVVLGIALLLWRPRPNPVTAALAGLSFAAAALTRYVGESLVLAGFLFCVLAAGRRFVTRLVTAGALLAAFALPVIGYAAFATPSAAVSTGLYARVAASVTCARLSLPSYERPLCPPPGVVKPRAGSLIQGYALGTTSPLVTYRPPKGETTGQVLDDFVKRAVLQQPLPVAKAIGGSLMRPFLSWSRDHRPGELPIARWQFQTVFPLYFTRVSLSLFHRWEGHGPVINRPLARILRRYQLSVGYTPGPVLLACVILALAAGLGVGRARRSGQQLACLLWLAAGLGLLFTADLYQFSWRYQLPVLVTIPPAAALALSALTSPRKALETPATQEPAGPDDSASAGQDDSAASRHGGPVDPVEGTAHRHEPAGPSPAQHHRHADGPPGPGGHPGMPGPAPGGSPLPQ
jgi:Dolichyl-phosphate-mannose-protein mannosyltransferase